MDDIQQKSVMTFDEYYTMWSNEHTYGASKIVKGWLKLSYLICRYLILPLKLTPIGLDFIGVFLAILVGVIFSLFPLLNELGLLIAGLSIAWIILSIGMIDNLDGAVARLTGIRSKRGSYQDLIFDRCIDGIVLISPIFSGMTRGSAVLFLIFTVFFYENLRSIHISEGIPIFSTVAERHARLTFHIGYLVISCIGYYLASLGYNVLISINGKIIAFWPNLDILYISLGLISIIGMVQIFLKIRRRENINLILKQIFKLLVDIIILSVLFFRLSENYIIIFINYCLSIQFLHTTNILNKRRKIEDQSVYFSYKIFIFLNISNLILIFTIDFFLFEYVFIYFIILTIIILFFDIKKIIKANSIL